jgi:hypothetical protein
MTVSTNLSTIRTKVRAVTGRPSVTQITDAQIDQYVNTFYLYDLSEHVKMESLRYYYQFTTQANVPVYDLPTDTYLTAMTPVFIAGYMCFMTQSRQNFFRNNSELQFLQQSLYTGSGAAGGYTGQFLTNLPVIQGFKPNPPGAFSISVGPTDIAAKFLNWNVIVYAEGTPDATSGITPTLTLIDDGHGNLFAPTDTSTAVAARRGTINYITGALDITVGFTAIVPSGNAINVQYTPYVASRPQSVMFYQDQIYLYPIPDQAYTVSFEAYKYPTALANASDNPQLREWWQALGMGASLKIFEDNADFENIVKYRPLLDEYLRKILRRSIVQQTSERTATIYEEQHEGMSQWGFGNLFGNQ